MPPPPALATDALAKTYRGGLFGSGGTRALDGVSLTVGRGEIFGLLGPNGAGKTTLVKILLGIVHATEGTARLLGRPVRDPAARARVGFLPEKHQFPGHLTARQMLHLYGRLSGIASDERARRIPELLARVGMGDHAESKVKRFSKGMMQRVGLAQALLGRPEVVFLDEPTDGVDPVGRREIRDLLVWMRGEGTTVFLNSHLLSEVEKVCTRVAIMNAGRLVRTGTIDELTAVERVYDLTATPVPDEARAALGEALRPLDDAAPPPADAALRRYRLAAASRADLNAALDRLRDAHVEIEAVQPRRRSLEDYFIDVVERGSNAECQVSNEAA
jgi:ABC-2 type transport system ATP-binding protein